MQPKRLLVYITQALLLAASAVVGGTAVRQEVSATTPDPVTILHVAPAQHRQIDPPAEHDPAQAGEADQVRCLPVSAYDGESHRTWLRDDAPSEDRRNRSSGS